MKKILIVDDEKLLTDAYRMVLVRAGYDVKVANDPRKGLELAALGKPDLIFLDMLMPDLNGVEFVKELNAKKLAHKPLIVAFSNIDNPEVIAAAKKIGAAKYLLKVDYIPRQLAEIAHDLLKK